MSHRVLRPFGPMLVVAVLMLVLLPSGAAAATLGSRTLRLGMVGSDVAALQRALCNLGTPTRVDGQFGRSTARAVRQWKSWTHVRANGIVTRADVRRLRRQLRARLRAPLARADTPDGGGTAAMVDVPPATSSGGATLTSTGLAVAPVNAPPAVQAIIAAGNKIASKPYVYGGGHASWSAAGYDCSGSVSYALRGANLLDSPLTSGDFARWGARGRGQWVTIYANSGHVFMVVAGLRFDTSGRNRTGSRWQLTSRPTGAYVARHIEGL